MAAALGLWFILQHMTGITESELYRELLKRDFQRFNDAPLLQFMKNSPEDFSSCDEFRRWSSRVRINSDSVRFTRQATYHPKKNHIVKRGSIRFFSRHSRLRLRDSLSSAYVSDSEVFGLTLTLPWQVGLESLSSCLERYRLCFNRFTTYFRRAFPLSAAIFRHELQKRKMPHCHLVVFFSHCDVQKGVDLNELRYRIFKIWNESLLGYYGGGSKTAFAKHGIKLDNLDDQVAMFRYVSDHASKSKQAQLGYLGKQWGYINRKVISIRPFDDYQFRFQGDLIFFQRHISKLMRFKVKSDCVFGFKLSHKTNGVSICFVNSKTVKKIFDYIEKSRGKGVIFRDDFSYLKFNDYILDWRLFYPPLVCNRLRFLINYCHDSVNSSGFACHKCLSDL